MSFFSKFFNKRSFKKKNKIVESKFLPKKKSVIEERFITKFIDNGGKFLYCESIKEVQDYFNKIIEEIIPEMNIIEVVLNLFLN